MLPYLLFCMQKRTNTVFFLNLHFAFCILPFFSVFLCFFRVFFVCFVCLCAVFVCFSNFYFYFYTKAICGPFPKTKVPPQYYFTRQNRCQIRRERRSVYEDAGVSVTAYRGDRLTDGMLETAFFIYKSTIDKVCMVTTYCMSSVHDYDTKETQFSEQN